MGSDPFMTGIEARTPRFFASATVRRGSDPIKSTASVGLSPWSENQNQKSVTPCTNCPVLQNCDCLRIASNRNCRPSVRLANCLKSLPQPAFKELPHVFR